MKLSTIRFLLLALLLAVKTNIYAVQFEVNGIKYLIITSSKVQVAQKKGYAGDIVIPENVEYKGITYSVTSIGNEAFSWCSDLTSVTIPNSVTHIGVGAFLGCSSLASVTFGNSVTSIGLQAFKSCTSLTSVTIPNNVKSIENETFKDCSSLTSVTIPNSVTSIGFEAFSGCVILTYLTIGSGITHLTYDAFEGCSGLRIKLLSKTPPEFWGQDVDIFSLEVPLGSTIEYAQSSYWNKANEIYAIDNDVYYFPLFFEEKGEHIVSVSQMKGNAIEVASNALIQIVADGTPSPNSLIIVGNQDVSELISNKGKFEFYPSKLYKENIIQTYSYTNKEIHVANSGTLIDKIGIDNLEKTFNLKLSGELNGTDILAIRKMKNLRILDLTETSIVDGGISYYQDYVTSKDIIGERFFHGLDSLVTVMLPKNITSINRGAFNNCSSLKTMTIPQSVKSIATDAFCGCSNLISLTIENGIISIGHGAFASCSNLTSVKIPDSVTSIGSCAFAACSSLSSLTIGNSVIEIKDNAFSGCRSLTSVTIPNSVNSIGYRAFVNCPNINYLTIGDGVSEIGYNAFNGCIRLTSLTIPYKVKSIGNGVFEGCYNLTSVTSLNTTPPQIIETTFENTTYANATLYVPKGCKTVYWLNPGWENFKSIVELGDTGIDDVTVDLHQQREGIYTIDGVKLSSNADNTDNLLKGIYIINGQKVVIK